MGFLSLEVLEEQIGDSYSGVLNHQYQGILPNLIIIVGPHYTGGYIIGTLYHYPVQTAQPVSGYHGGGFTEPTAKRATLSPF